MIVFHNLSKNFKDRPILKSVSGAINPKDRIALIGKNGAGKTTLMQVLQGALMPDDGIVQTDEVAGYVQQEISNKQQTVHESFGSYSWRVDAALAQVDLSDVDGGAVIQTLSGGQRTRLSFAHVLAMDPEPSVLLLDEPTNNLDADGLTWLRQFVAKFDGAVLFASHDRAFINELATTIWELEDGMVTVYGGNYDFYKQEKQHIYEMQQKRYTENITERKKVERLIRTAQTRAVRGVRDQRPRDNDKFLRDFKNTQVQNSLGGQAKALQTRLEQMDTMSRPAPEYDLRLSLPGAVHADKLILEVQHLSKAYINQLLFDNVNFTLRGDDRLVVLGPNGVGKSTLFRIILGIEQATLGQIRLGVNVRVGYFAQDMYGINPADTVLETLLGTGMDRSSAHAFAVRLGIGKQSLGKRAAQLSRGQQAKLGMVQLLYGDYQLLVLDEPTNHLDVYTRESLEMALSKYKGAIIFTSHDQYFQKNMCPSAVLRLG